MCQIVRLYNVVDIVVMSGDVVCCSVVCSSLVSSVCEYQNVECAFTSPVSFESGMLVTCCMQCAMSVSTVLLCGDVLSVDGKYVYATVMCLVLPCVSSPVVVMCCVC